MIGSVSQHTGAVGLLTGQENLTLQGSLYGMRGKDLRRRVRELLDQFGLAEAARRQARTYSGGMRRRLDIATVLVHRPAVLFLDEPTTGLDPEGRAALWAVLTDLAAQDGTTILVTTHYLEEADQYAARIAIVDQGRVVAEGTADQLKSELDGDSVLLELDGSGSAERVRLRPGWRSAGPAGDGGRQRRAGPRRRRTAGAARRAGRGRGRRRARLSVRVARPSLDDVYLHHAGRSFHQAERIAA